MKRPILFAFASALILSMGILPGHAQDGKVLAQVQPADDAIRAVAWYNLSEPPAEVKSRDIAQTFKVVADGKLQKFVFPLQVQYLTSQPTGNAADFPFTVTIFNHGANIPTDRFIQKDPIAQQGKAEINANDHTFVVQLDAPVHVQAGSYYTLMLSWDSASPDYKISLPQIKGSNDYFRWHRPNRGSWIHSPDSLVFIAIGK